LTTEEGFAVLDELALMGTPICVLSGGDPAKRSDLCALIRHGKNSGMRMATIPAATPLLTRELVENLKDAGLSQMALSLDGPTPEVHDNFRGTPGAFDRTLEGSIYAAEVGLPLQINTVFSAYNAHYFDSMTQLVRLLDVVFWEVFFLVPMGRGKELGQLNAAQFEALFAKLADFAHSVKFIVKVTEAPHYRRYLMQQRRLMECGRNDPRCFTAGVPRFYRGQLPAHMRRDFGPGGSIGLAPKGVNSGNGHLFISYCGDICPSGFLPLACGNIRTHSIAGVYRGHRVFCELRNPDLLRGKCGVCEFRNICGGSRARAYAMAGDYLAEEPFCAYRPNGSACPEQYASFT
jgi:radical SAM protein with 4Fe4S-binding SPASM domain